MGDNFQQIYTDPTGTHWKNKFWTFLRDGEAGLSGGGAPKTLRLGLVVARIHWDGWHYLLKWSETMNPGWRMSPKPEMKIIETFYLMLTNFSPFHSHPSYLHGRGQYCACCTNTSQKDDDIVGCGRPLGWQKLKSWFEVWPKPEIA